MIIFLYAPSDIVSGMVRIKNIKLSGDYYGRDEYYLELAGSRSRTRLCAAAKTFCSQFAGKTRARSLNYAVVLSSPFENYTFSPLVRHLPREIFGLITQLQTVMTSPRVCACHRRRVSTRLLRELHRGTRVDWTPTTGAGKKI